MNNRANHGFTLVELAVSIVVIGLLLALGTAMIGPLMAGIKTRESKENLGAAVESINGWASGNNRIPPFTPTAPDTVRFDQIVKTPTDAWTRELIYLYDSTLAPTGAMLPSKDTICGRRSTFITLTDSNTGASIQNVAYVILSQGDDAIPQTNIGGTAVTSGPRTASTTIAANTTDDLVRWVTLDELRTKVGCQGAQLRIVNNELPFGYATSAYTANITADGGVPYAASGKYRWCVQYTDLATPASKPIFRSSDGSTGIAIGSNCSSLPESSWTQSDYITINLSVVTQSAKAYTCIVSSPPSQPPNPTAWSEIGSSWSSGSAYASPATVVVGTAAYTCKQSHTSDATNQPGSGANWRNYWSSTGTAWASGTSYIAPPTTSAFTIFTRDDNDSTGSNDNLIYKQFVLTINPQ